MTLNHAIGNARRVIMNNYIRTNLFSAFDCIWLLKRLPQVSAQREHTIIYVNPQHTGICPLCPTRWMVKTSAIDAILKHYPALLDTFETINAESHDDHGCRARGVFLSLLQCYETLFGLHLSHLIFSATEQTRRSLQSQDTSVQETLSAVNIALAFIKDREKIQLISHFIH